MNLIPSSTRWPVYLAIAGMVIVAASVWYTNRLASGLADVEKKYVDLYQEAINRLVENSRAETDSTSTMDDTSIEFEIMASMESVPRILVNRRGGIDDWFGFGARDEHNPATHTVDSLYIAGVLKQWIREGRRPVAIDAQLQYFGESKLLRELRYFPWIQLLLVSSFVFLGYLGINQTRRAEQNRVWVGLAKETAHQLGTPISAIMGWVEHLRLLYGDDEDITMVADELQHDVERLSMVANRFSKIGATPELEERNLYEELNKCRDYMQKRAPRKVTFDFPEPAAGNVPVAINPLLFDWVFENLLRNALDAMDGKGHLSSTIREQENKVMIDITDTGKGIQPKNIRKVFNPGFTTKKRGWGLGLSLVKRIVEEYHNGKIVVSKSEPGVGTTFTITLPKAPAH